ncbi:Cytochrome P450 2F5 [Vulpes lagopus]
MDYPQSSDVITLLGTVCHNLIQFLMPQEFNCEHFLDASQSFKKIPAFMPFSAVTLFSRQGVGCALVAWTSPRRAWSSSTTSLTVILHSFSLQPQGAPKDIDVAPIDSCRNRLA